MLVANTNKKPSYNRDSARRPHKPYIAKNDSLGCIFVADVRLASVNLTQLAPKAAVLCEITFNDNHWAVRRFWYRSKARMRLPTSE